MLHIAIVEDNNQYAALLAGFAERFQQEKGQLLHITRYSNGLDFMEEYTGRFDVVFMDIEMPNLDGMATARRLRQVDQNVCLIFVTNLAQYAVSGYEVSALDFMVKPVGYFDFSLKLQKALRHRASFARQEVVLSTEKGFKRLSVQDIYFIEVSDHRLIYYTRDGSESERGTIREKEQALAPLGFARCSNSYLVNLRHVSEISGNSLVVGGQSLNISRSKKIGFMDALTRYLGEAMQ